MLPEGHFSGLWINVDAASFPCETRLVYERQGLFLQLSATVYFHSSTSFRAHTSLSAVLKQQALSSKWEHKSLSNLQGLGLIEGV